MPRPVPKMLTPRRCLGFSLIELMVAITIGLAVLAGLVTIFSNSSATYGELEKTAQQIENGRYAIDLIGQDLRHAGFYGQFQGSTAIPAALADPCEVANLANLNAGLVLPVQGTSAPDFTTAPVAPGTCAAWLTAANLVPGSDILVIRRAHSAVITAAPTLNEVYVQANPVQAEVQIGNPAGFSLPSLNADNSVAVVGTNASGVAATVLKKDNVAGAAPVIPAPRVAADIRKYHVHVYFVAPCSIPQGGGDICTGATDDGGQPIPTLKRLELTQVGGATTMRVVPLVEGIERLRTDYGLDNQPAGVNPATQSVGDGVPDQYTATPALADWRNTVTAKVFLLARSPRRTAGHSDTKTYTLGLAGTTAAANDAFKRHVFSAAVRLVDIGGRREIPE